MICIVFYVFALLQTIGCWLLFVGVDEKNRNDEKCFLVENIYQGSDKKVVLTPLNLFNYQKNDS
jgi:hypothetical protein